MKLYEYRQINTRGFYIDPCELLYVEAETSDGADIIAQSIGIYFDGIVNDSDCDCRGDRWDRASERDSYSTDKLYDIINNMRNTVPAGETARGMIVFANGNILRIV